MDFTKLTDFIDSLEFLGVVGCDISVKYKHKEVCRHTMGYSDVGKTKPSSKSDIYWIYSMTKIITCTAALRLVERGKLGLDDKVSDYLPEYADVTVLKDSKPEKAQNPMTVRHLFAMRSGMGYNINDPVLKKACENNEISTRELVGAMARMPLNFEPGTDFQYSFSHDVLAAIVEVVSGMSYHEYLKKEIFIPLGMTDIGFFPTDEQRSRFTQQYNYNKALFRAEPKKCENEFCLSRRYESGGAGLFSTLDSYMPIIDALANKGTAENGYQVLRPETIELMRTNQQHEGFIHRPGYSYGLGVRVMVDKVGGNSRGPLGEFGWDSAASSYNMVDPDNNIAVVFTLHIRNFDMAYFTIHPYIRNLVYEALGLAD